ncbi:hypothetical protein CLAIMM_06953, partial [Cladophialophora immunda]
PPSPQSDQTMVETPHFVLSSNKQSPKYEPVTGPARRRVRLEVFVLRNVSPDARPCLRLLAWCGLGNLEVYANPKTKAKIRCREIMRSSGIPLTIGLNTPQSVPFLLVTWCLGYMTGDPSRGLNSAMRGSPEAESVT